MLLLDLISLFRSHFYRATYPTLQMSNTHDTVDQNSHLIPLAHCGIIDFLLLRLSYFHLSMYDTQSLADLYQSEIISSLLRLRMADQAEQ